MNSNNGKKTKKPCGEFKPQMWKEDACSECSFSREEHTKSMFETHFGADELKKEDPTSVFELIDIIGSGAYGSVFMGKEISSGKIYAIKFLELDKSKGNEIASIVNEINIMKESFECSFVVEYNGVYMKDEIIMLVMEYCDCSVEDILSFCPEIQFEEEQIAAVCAAIVKGLAFLHSDGISHRDIKSGNVLLKESGEVKLADFGVSHKLQHERDKMKTLAGSPYWCAPELITADSYNNKVDIWACGIVALEMAESRPPHWDLAPLEVIFHIPKQPPPRLKEPGKWSVHFVDFIDRCLRKNPDERATAKELLNHAFILNGSSSQILVPLMEKCLPIVIPRKREDLKAEEPEDELTNPAMTKGTMLTVDKSTFTADIVSPENDPDKSQTTIKKLALTGAKQGPSSKRPGVAAPATTTTNNNNAGNSKNQPQPQPLPMPSPQKQPSQSPVQQKQKESQKKGSDQCQYSS